jgi:hypothetical protein
MGKLSSAKLLQFSLPLYQCLVANFLPMSNGSPIFQNSDQSYFQVNVENVASAEGFNLGDWADIISRMRMRR